MKNPMFKIVNYLRDMLAPKKAVRCIRCGRILKDPQSVKRGYGRVCWKRYNQDLKKYHEDNRPLSVVFPHTRIESPY